MTDIATLIALIPSDIMTLLVTVLFWIVAVALVASLIVEGLKHLSIVGDGTSGKWSAVINMVLVVGVYVLTQLGHSEMAQAASKPDVLIPLLLGSGFVTTIVSKLIYTVSKWTGLATSFSAPKG